MEPLEPRSHSFVVKVWLEETAQGANPARWRGHITHVASGQRRYLQDLNSISAFIALYLAQMGVKCGPGWRLKQWLTWWK